MATTDKARQDMDVLGSDHTVLASDTGCSLAVETFTIIHNQIGTYFKPSALEVIQIS